MKHKKVTNWTNAAVNILDSSNKTDIYDTLHASSGYDIPEATALYMSRPHDCISLLYCSNITIHNLLLNVWILFRAKGENFRKTDRNVYSDVRSPFSQIWPLMWPQRSVFHCFQHIFC